MLAYFQHLLKPIYELNLLLTFAVAAAWLARHADEAEEKQRELRDGRSGVGLYDKSDVRIDMGDSDEP